MPDNSPTPEQVKRLVDASESLCAYFARCACRVIAEADDDDDMLPFLDEPLKASLVREFDSAVMAVTWPDEPAPDAAIQSKYEAAMAEMRLAKGE